jgi:hypothetical protein
MRMSFRSWQSLSPRSVSDGVLKRAGRIACLTGKAGNAAACARVAHPGSGHRPCHSATLTRGQPGAQIPRPAPAPPRRALPARRVGRWPLSVRVAWVLVVALRGGGGNAVRFLFPPAPTKAPSPLPWQGPSPLPHRHVDPRPAGGPKPPASARPAHGGRWPAGVPGPADLRGTVMHGRGKRMRFLVPPGEAVFLSLPGCPVTLAGAIAPATAPR